MHLLLRLRKAVEQLGLFGITTPVKAHTRHTPTGKTVTVQQHRRKRRPLTSQEITEIRHRMELKIHSPEDEARLAEQQAWVRAQYEGTKRANERIRADGLDERQPGGAGGWRTFLPVDPDTGEFTAVIAQHPDQQVRVVVGLDGNATLQHRKDGSDLEEWVDAGRIPRRSSMRVEADLLAREIRRKHGPWSEHEAARAKADHERDTAHQTTTGIRSRWVWGGDDSWSKMWTRAKEILRRTSGVGEIRQKRNVREISPGVVRADIEVTRLSDGEVVGRGTWIDETGREPDGTAALWQMPNGAHVRLPEGHEGAGRTYRVEWSAMDRPAPGQVGDTQVMLRPLGYGLGIHVDATMLVHRQDDEDKIHELAACMALEHAVSRAFDEAPTLPPQPWPPRPSRGGVYNDTEWLSVVQSRSSEQPPEAQKLAEDIRAWRSKLRREIGDHAFHTAMEQGGDDNLDPDVRRGIGHWAESMRSSRRHEFGGKTAAEQSTPEHIQAKWAEFWPGYEAGVRKFMATAANPALYDRRSSPEYLAERLLTEDEPYQSRQLFKTLVERRGFRFGRRHNVPEWYTITDAASWRAYRTAHNAAHASQPLVLENEGARSAESPTAASNYKSLHAALRDLGDKPHEAIVEKNGWGEWTFNDPVTGERVGHHWPTRREARERAQRWLQMRVEEEAKKAGSAAVAEAHQVETPATVEPSPATLDAMQGLINENRVGTKRLVLPKKSWWDGMGDGTKRGRAMKQTESGPSEAVVQGTERRGPNADVAGSTPAGLTERAAIRLKAPELAV